jgi:hypothetical protein
LRTIDRRIMLGSAAGPRRVGAVLLVPATPVTPERALRKQGGFQAHRSDTDSGRAAISLPLDCDFVLAVAIAH